ncbi:hypothetical protein D3C72_1778600 [compost metagenome]
MLLQQRRLFHAQAGMDLRRTHLDHHVDRGPQAGRVDNGRTGGAVVSVGERRFLAGAALHHHLVAELEQFPDRVGRGGNAPLARVDFAWHTDRHWHGIHRFLEGIGRRLSRARG